MGTVVDTLNQLRAARDIVLADPTPYPQVVAGILQVISPSAQLEARRWGADFLAESFASQVLASEVKQQLSVVVLDTLGGWLGRKQILGEEEDICVVKSAIQCAASIYPYVFRHTVNTSDQDAWQKLSNIKSAILSRMDTASPGIRICCMKFSTIVVQTQTQGLIADPRRQDQNEISLALVRGDHAVLSSSILEAQASGLLDRLLSVFQDSPEDALIVTATLNALASLVQKRPGIMTKIIPAVLSFDPLRLANKPMSGKDKISVRSMTRTTMSFLLNNYKLTKNNPFAGRIQQHIERMKHNLNDAFSESRQLKRPAIEAPVDGLDDVKRQRIEHQTANGSAQAQQALQIPPLPSGPVSLAQVFTLTNDINASTFPAQQLNAEIVCQLVPAIVQTLTQERIEQAVNAVRERLATLSKNAPTVSVSVNEPSAAEDDDDDDYDPSIGIAEDAEKPVNGNDMTLQAQAISDVAIAPFSLPRPQPLSVPEREEYSRTALTRMFGTLSELDKEARSKAAEAEKDAKLKAKDTTVAKGFNRLAASSLGNHDREGWLTLLTRLSTRAPFGTRDHGSDKQQNGNRSIIKQSQGLNLANEIRQALLNYIMENFRARIGIAIMWLNEEWYAERILERARQKDGVQETTDSLQTYWHWTLRLFDMMITYFDIRDGKILIRFLSEVPAIDRDMLRRVKKIAEDPDRVQMTVHALLYLIKFRPPVRELALNCMEEMWRENDDAKAAVKKVLEKFRPAFFAEEEQSAGVKQEP